MKRRFRFERAEKINRLIFNFIDFYDQILFVVGEVPLVIIVFVNGIVRLASSSFET